MDNLLLHPLSYGEGRNTALKQTTANGGRSAHAVETQGSNSQSSAFLDEDRDTKVTFWYTSPSSIRKVVLFAAFCAGRESQQRLLNLGG
jgi:hypothetical protein